MASASDRERLERLFGGPALARFRARLRARFARGRVGAVVTLGGLNAHERDTLEGLLGRRAREAASLRVSLAELDEALARAELAPSLRAALELLEGPIPDLVADRTRREQAWAEVFAAASGELLGTLVANTAHRGLVKRLAGGEPAAAAALLADAARVLGCLPASGVPRSQLAAEVLGDAHALDRDRPLATLILFALRSDEVERPRDIWARAGVLVNELAKPVLTLNLLAEPNGTIGALTHAAARAGEPVSLTLRVLMRSPAEWLVRGRDVFVCENANLLTIAADQLGAACAPLVCTDGMPSAAQRTLLRQLADAGATLRYHGDFDWPGLTIANHVLRNFGAVPWRFDAAHYRPRPGRKLKGTPVVASWDESLTAAMLAGGHALDEEAVADLLLQDLGFASATGSTAAVQDETARTARRDE